MMIKMLWSLINMVSKFKIQNRQGTTENTERGKSHRIGIKWKLIQNRIEKKYMIGHKQCVEYNFVVPLN